MRRVNNENIYAGLNGLEVGQSIVIGSFVLIHNILVSRTQALGKSHSPLSASRR